MSRKKRGQERIRLIKWVGDPRLVKEDGFGVPNWKYENNRAIAIAGHTRVLNKGDGAEVYPDGTPVPYSGLSRDYVWDGRGRPDFILPVLFDDAIIILRKQGNEFKDVTDVRHPEQVTSDLVVVPSKKTLQAKNARP